MSSSPYDVFENEDGACLQQIKSIVFHLTDQGSFGGQSIVKEEGVIRLISATYYQMVAMMAEYFYSPVQTDKNVLGVLQWFNALGAASKIELAVAVAGMSPTENNRHSWLWDQFQ